MRAPWTPGWKLGLLRVRVTLFLEPRRHLVRCYGRAGLEAPWSICQRLGGSNLRGGNAGACRTRKNNAAEQRTAIEKPVAGNGING